MQFGEHDLQRRDLPLGVPIDGDAAPVVGDLNRLVAVQSDFNLAGEPGGGLVDSVVDQLPHQVHEPGSASSADVHARALSDSIQTLEGLNGVGVVAVTRPLAGALARALAGALARARCRLL